MSKLPLPTRKDFIKNNLETIDTCEICHESFNDRHVATRIRGPNACRHIFGATCLRSWMNSGQAQPNSCPKCREVLYKMPLRPPVFHDGKRPGHALVGQRLEDMSSRRFARTFANELWLATGAMSNALDEVFDSDLEDFISMVVWRTEHQFEGRFDQGINVPSRTWPALKNVAKQMIVKHRENGQMLLLSQQDMNTVWIPRLCVLIGWKLREG